jgi:hypothetical protein
MATAAYDTLTLLKYSDNGAKSGQFKGPQEFASALTPSFVQDIIPKAGGTSDTILQKALDADAAATQKLTQDAQDTLDELDKAIDSNDNAKLEEIAATLDANPKLADKVKGLMEDAALTPDDKKIKSLGIASGARAQYINDKLASLNDEDAAAFLQNLIDKKLLTAQVEEQLIELAKKK